jgi:ketosteroid isomerase-like protein
MPAYSAEDVDRMFVRAMNERDIDTIMSLYGPDTIFVQEPGKPPIRGESALRRHLESFLAVEPNLKVELKQFVEAGDIAFFSVRWTLRGHTPDGGDVHLTSADGNVVRRQADGTWKTLIDNPFHEEYLKR